MKSFQDVLAEAVGDIVEHGYDSVERVDRWMREIRMAAEASLISPASLEQRLADSLAAIYKEMVDDGAVMKRHPGVGRFTLDMIKPHLRAELDRRIAASANLIKVKRSTAIDQTLSRFQGWSTSIPPGGVSAEKRRDVKENVRRSMASLPFEERRVLVDQGHKLASSISEIVATDGGAIAGVWRSNYRQAGYDYREDHAERDGKFYLVRDSWAHRAGLVKRGKVGYYDEITAAAQEPFCRCYIVWIYNVRDLPEDMVTKEGRRRLVEVGMHTNATRAYARADSDEKLMPQREANYLTWWPSKPTRCGRCSMFEVGVDPRVNACSAVEGEIARNGHCKLFEIETARADSADPEPAIGAEALRRQLVRLRREVDAIEGRRVV